MMPFEAAGRITQAADLRMKRTETYLAEPIYGATHLSRSWAVVIVSKFCILVANGAVEKPLHDGEREPIGALGSDVERAFTRKVVVMTEVRAESTEREGECRPLEPVVHRGTLGEPEDQRSQQTVPRRSAAIDGSAAERSLRRGARLPSKS
jgi:hypothetical protein